MEDYGEMVRRAELGAHIVFIYPNLGTAKDDMHLRFPTATLRVSDMQWRFPSGGRVTFRTVGIDPNSLRGLVAEFVWRYDAYECAPQELRDMVYERNSHYKHRMNSRYPVDESDC